MSGLYRVTRRDFLRHTGVGAGALMFGFSLWPDSASAGALKDLLTTGAPLGAFVKMKLNGDITIISHRSEMGQGIRSTLAALLADEMGADWSRVHLDQADADAPSFAVENPLKDDPNSWPKFPVSEEVAQFADSSRSMVLYFTSIRAFGAGLRLLMLRAAGHKWHVEPAECEVSKHTVRHPKSGRSTDFRHLLLHASKVKPPTGVEALAAITPIPKWTYACGKEKMPFYDAKDMVTGKARYCADKDLPGLLTAMIIRCPVANGGLKSFDATAALAVPGVKHVQAVLPP
ncbi:MAG TPA: molybdopterin cofactor-binding domain-containing protein, partial [Thermoanaerobaculia bacterium]|nr:molybdopterin cofactor-binding domain-containing protein [Thermoanaerobaculia bacterium]